jgi:membrane-bound lytic murein transglycosylase D
MAGYSTTITNSYRSSTPPIDIAEIEVIKFRIARMDCPVDVKYNEDITHYLKRYLTYGIADTEKMLGNGILYFPIFEHYLEMHDLPEQLKFLPMVESSMKPYASSYAGAAGLWQFMPSTGKHMGLIVDQYIDERKDPYKSSEAAVKYLKKLYKKFGTWELALAAYNCGPSRLNKVIKAYGSKDFWTIKKGLPVQTQRYISKFVAACYIGTFHRFHGISPRIPNVHCLQPMAGRVYSPISLRGISATAGVGLDTLRELNPSCKLNYSPARARGVFLVLPREAWNGYLEAESNTAAQP